MTAIGSLARLVWVLHLLVLFLLEFIVRRLLMIITMELLLMIIFVELLLMIIVMELLLVLALTPTADPQSSLV